VSRYKLVVTKSAKKDIDKLDPVTRQRIGKKLQYFLEQDDPLSLSRQLVSAKLGSYRFRVGHYRIVFDVHEETIEVLAIKHRKDVYISS
jgi:mRNA interferase RelE/StbE